MRVRTRTTIGCLSLMAMSGGGCSTASTSTAMDRQVRDEVVAFLHDWNGAIALQDAEAIRAKYVREGARFAWFEDGVLRYDSPEEILGALRRFPPGTSVYTELTDINVTPLSGDDAYASARFDTRIEMPTGPFAFDGVFTVLLSREENGWVMTRGHTSSRRVDMARGIIGGDDQ